MLKPSVIRSSISGRKIVPLTMDAKQITSKAVQEIAREFGIVFDHATVLRQVHLLYEGGAGSGAAMDAAFVAPATAASVPTPVQFLQTWLPGFIKVMTSARKIDDLIGVKTVGSWEDQEIVQGIVEPAATATEYGDFTNIPLALWNTNFIKRTIVRGEIGIQVGLLEEGRSAAMRLSSAETKRQGSAVGLEIFRNAVGFYGWNSGNNQTYGFLNDPNLPAYISSSVTGGWGKRHFPGDHGRHPYGRGATAYAIARSDQPGKGRYDVGSADGQSRLPDRDDRLRRERARLARPDVQKDSR